MRVAGCRDHGAIAEAAVCTSIRWGAWHLSGGKRPPQWKADGSPGARRDFSDEGLTRRSGTTQYSHSGRE